MQMPWVCQYGLKVELCCGSAVDGVANGNGEIHFRKWFHEQRFYPQRFGGFFGDMLAKAGTHDDGYFRLNLEHLAGEMVSP